MEDDANSSGCASDLGDESHATQKISYDMLKRQHAKYLKNARSEATIVARTYTSVSHTSLIVPAVQIPELVKERLLMTMTDKRFMPEVTLYASCTDLHEAFAEFVTVTLELIGEDVDVKWDSLARYFSLPDLLNLVTVWNRILCTRRHLEQSAAVRSILHEDVGYRYVDNFVKILRALQATIATDELSYVFINAFCVAFCFVLPPQK
jgi:hypothetical protein